MHNADSAPVREDVLQTAGTEPVARPWTMCYDATRNDKKAVLKE